MQYFLARVITEVKKIRFFGKANFHVRHLADASGGTGKCLLLSVFVHETFFRWFTFVCDL